MGRKACLFLFEVDRVVKKRGVIKVKVPKLAEL